MLLRPSANLNGIVVGVLGRAQRRFEMPIHAVVVMSNHFHLLASPPDAKRLADFMAYFKTNLSKEVGKLHGWEGPMWHRRYDAIPVSDEEPAQVERLRYLLSHGCKEGLVGAPGDWPGVHSIDLLVEDKPLQGKWFNRTLEYEARQRGERPTADEFAVDEQVLLTPLPAWEHLEAGDYRQQIAEMVQDIEEETHLRHRRLGTRPLGVQEILQVHPLDLPEDLKTSSKPQFHAATREKRRLMNRQFKEWLTVYMEASKAWRAGDLFAKFPPWSFRPPSKWIGEDPPDTG